MPSDWEQITPNSLTNAVARIRDRFAEIEFKFSFLTQQKCYKELHSVASTTTPSAVFRGYMGVYEEGLKETIREQFDDLLEIGLANKDVLEQHPIEWAQSHLKFLIEDKSERVTLWIKNVCDQQPMTKSTAPEDMDEFIYWRSWRAPKFIVMQPSANLRYDPHSVWERENELQTQKYLDGLSKRFFNGLNFRLEAIVGDAYVKLAKRGVRIQNPSVQKSPSEAVAKDGSNTPPQRPIVFISYSWDSEPHKQWVLDLASRLQGEGVQIVLDRWHLERGGDKNIFMEKAVTTSKFVILICTPTYAERANNRAGGVGYEATIITAELAENINQKKFIPVLRHGDWQSSLPVWIKSKLGVDLRGDPYLETEYKDLLRTLHGEPLTPPPLGPKPAFGNGSLVDQEVVPSQQTKASLTPHQLEAIRRKLAVVQINAWQLRLTIWMTNRTDLTIRVKSASLWHRQKRLSYGVPSDGRKSVEVRPHTEKFPIAFATDEDPMLKLQSLGAVDRHLPSFSFISEGVDIEIRIEYEVLGVEDELRETKGVRVNGNGQIESL